GLDRRLLAALGRHAALVGARALDVALAACAVARSRPAAAPLAAAPLAHRAETLAVAATPAAALAGGAEPLRRAPPPPGLVLLAEPGLLLGHPDEALGHDLALVDPDLHADPAEGRLRLDEPVVDVRANRVQRDAPLGVGLAAAHLGTAEAAAADDLDPVRARADRRRERALHRPPEADPVLEVLGDRLRDELRVELGPLDLVDVDVDVPLRERVQLLTERVDLDARL